MMTKEEALEALRLADEKRQAERLEQEKKRRYNEFLKLQKEFETNDL